MLEWRIKISLLSSFVAVASILLCSLIDRIWSYISFVVIKIAFSKDGTIPEGPAAVIENTALAEAILESIIGEDGISPAAKRSLAERMSEFMGRDEDVKEAEAARVEEHAQPVAAAWHIGSLFAIEMKCHVLWNKALWNFKKGSKNELIVKCDD